LKEIGVNEESPLFTRLRDGWIRSHETGWGFAWNVIDDCRLIIKFSKV